MTVFGTLYLEYKSCPSQRVVKCYIVGGAWHAHESGAITKRPFLQSAAPLSLRMGFTFAAPHPSSWRTFQKALRRRSTPASCLRARPTSVRAGRDGLDGVEPAGGVVVAED